MIDLSDPIGMESSRVTRVFGDGVLSWFSSELSNGIAFGDINADGRDDLVVGAPWQRGSGGVTGAVMIVPGRADLPSAVSLYTPTSGVAGQEIRITGDDDGDVFGFAIACGDVNGDGFDDVIAGAPWAGAADRAEAGEVHVIYGQPWWTPGTLLNLDGDGAISPLGETRILGADCFGEEDIFRGELCDRAGFAVACGDIDGDGYDDVILGAPGADGPGEEIPSAGEAYVVFGGPTLPGTIVDLRDPPMDDSVATMSGDDSLDRMGFAVTAADVNGDGLDDVVLGAPHSWGAANSVGDGAGEVFVIYGSPALRGTVVDLNSGGAISPAGETRIWADDPGDLFGWALAAADVDGDGNDDVIVGAPGARGRTGEVIVIYGAPGIAATGIDLNTNGLISGHGETRILGRGQIPRSNLRSAAGHSVAGGDVDGDGFSDVLVGEPNARFTGHVIGTGGEDFGRASLVLGGPALHATTVDFTAVSPELQVLGGEGSNRGWGEGAEWGGDLDGDGFAEFAFGAKHAATEGSRPGAAVAVYGSGDSPTAQGTEGHAPGSTPLRGFGGHLSPVLRTHLSFADGDNGAGGSSRTAVTLARSDAGITGLGDGSLSDVADVTWSMTTDRVGWSSATIAIQYTDAEVSAQIEGALRLWQAPSLMGPWAEVSSQSLDTVRNQVTATVTELGLFVLAETAGPSGATSGQILQHLLGRCPMEPRFDVNGDGFVDAADLVQNIAALGSQPQLMAP